MSTQERPAGRGASQARTTYADLWQAYLANHKLVMRDSLQRLLVRPIASLMTWLVIGIALSLPAGLYVALGNVATLSEGWDGAAQISLYLSRQVGDGQAQDMVNELAARGDIKAVSFVSREQALLEFREMSGFGEVLDGLSENPLPAVVVVYPKENSNAAASVSALRDELQQWPGVEQAQLDLEWVQRLYSMMELARRVTAVLALLLGVGVLLVIGNTIRLAIEARRDEIVVVKLVGGTDAFVRRPFLYTGMWYGLGGGMFATLIIGLTLFWVAEPVARLADLYKSDFELIGLGFVDTVGLWLTGALLGLLGAWLAVGRHLNDIEPR